jgi:NitT/TauT family transport system substrate-binding protein
MTILLYENLRTVVYTPFYLAVARGDWARAGVDVDVRLSPVPTETAEGLLAGRADVSWGGPMRVMLHHERDPDCPLVCFGQVVARDPFVLLGRQPNPAFRFADLVGPKVAVATDIPTSWMTLQDDLARAGIDPATLNRAPEAPMPENAARLMRGEVDVAQVLEPYAAQAVRDGTGHIWHRCSARGDIAYTTFYTTRAFANRAPETCAALTTGIAAALKALHDQPVAETARAVAPWFPDLDAGLLIDAIAGYRDAGLWARSTDLPPAAFVRLKAALLSGGLITRDIPYDAVVLPQELSP